MACNDIITIIPGGCLDEVEIKLSCKSPGEVKPYWISVANRMLSTDYIVNVSPQPASGSQVTVDKIEIEGQTFKCKIKGGKNNHNVGIRFVIFTHEENIIEFDCKLPIRQSGVLEKNGVFSSVLDTTSPAGTIAVNSTKTSPAGSEAAVNNVGTLSAALLDFVIPKGDKGETGLPGKDGSIGPPGPKGTAGNTLSSISITLSGICCTMSDGSSLNVMPEGIYIQDGIIIVPENIGVLPDDLILNGNIYTVPSDYLDGTKQLPTGLSSNSNVVMTDGSVFFPKTINNNGVLCAA